MARHVDVQIPHSKAKCAILDVLVSEGFIDGYTVSDEVKAQITVQLKYHNGGPVIEEIAALAARGTNLQRE